LICAKFGVDVVNISERRSRKTKWPPLVRRAYIRLYYFYFHKLWPNDESMRRMNHFGIQKYLALASKRRVLKIVTMRIDWRTQQFNL